MCEPIHHVFIVPPPPPPPSHLMSHNYKCPSLIFRTPCHCLQRLANADPFDTQLQMNSIICNVSLHPPLIVTLQKIFSDNKGIIIPLYCNWYPSPERKSRGRVRVGYLRQVMSFVSLDDFVNNEAVVWVLTYSFRLFQNLEKTMHTYIVYIGVTERGSA